MGDEIRNEFIIIWRIENFSSWCYRPHSKLKYSPTCFAENLKRRHFHLVLSYKRSKPAGEKSLACYLFSKVDVGGDEIITIECTMDIIDAGGETLQSKTFAKSPVYGYHRIDWENIMEFDELVNKMKNWTEDTLTVRCHMFSEVQTKQPAIECEIRTKIGVDRYYFVWKVRRSNTSDWSESKNFCFPDTAPIRITLSAPEDDILINIKGDRRARQSVTCRMSLIDIGGNERYSQIASSSFRHDAVWNFPTFFTKTILGNNKATLSWDCLFTLACNFSVLNFADINEVRYRTLFVVNTPFTNGAVSSLLDNWRDMFVSKKHADVKLRVDNEIFPVHKCLLAVRSPVFSAMFDQDMLESRTGIVDIEDFDVKTMNSFLEFIYTGTVDDMDYEKASNLLTAAEKYQVLSLKEKCASFLISILSEENVCEIHALGDMVGHELLKASALDYIKSPAGNVLHAPQYLKWSEEIFKLATEIF